MIIRLQKFGQLEPGTLPKTPDVLITS